MTLDIDDVAARLSLALRRVCGDHLPMTSDAAAADARAVTRYAAMIADAYAAGALDDDEMKRELQEIALRTHRYAGALQGVAGAVADRAGRAAVEVVFGALRSSLSFVGAPLPRGLAVTSA